MLIGAIYGGKGHDLYCTEKGASQFLPYYFNSLLYVRTYTIFSVKEPHAYSKSLHILAFQ